MQDQKQSDQIDEIIEELLGPRKMRGLTDILNSTLPRLDTSRPNIHESKKEFLSERDAVASIIENLTAAVQQVAHRDGDIEHQKMIDRLHHSVNVGAVQSPRYREMKTARDLAIRNIIDTGFYYNSLYIIVEMINVYDERFKELQDQEIEFWSLSHRAPNYYARTIALRFARLYAKELNKRPTFGIARDGNHPSTDFGRALEQIFQVLGIVGSVRNAADWALEQLTEDDFQTRQSSTPSGLFAGAGLALDDPPSST